MNSKEFTAELAKRNGYSVKTVTDMISSLINIMSHNWQDNNSISIQNFGTFEIKKKLERISVNPVTQQRMLVPPKLALTFRPSNVMKDKFK